MRRLIVTADDFGLTKTINDGIVKAYRDGIVTFISLTPTGEAFEETLEFIKDLKLEEMGAHLSLTETSPVTSPGKIPTLITRDDRFYKSHNEFFINFFLKKVKRDQIYIELKSQLDRLRNSSVKIMNLSSHEYIHMVPQILDIFVQLAKEYDIPSIRYPNETNFNRTFDINAFYRSFIASYFTKGMERILEETGLIHTDYFLGFLDSGRLEERKLICMLKSLKDGATELVSHPGFLGPEVLDRYRFHINCEAELFALTSSKVKKLIKESDIKLISYREFLASGRH